MNTVTDRFTARLTTLERTLDGDVLEVFAALYDALAADEIYRRVYTQLTKPKPGFPAISCNSHEAAFRSDFIEGIRKTNWLGIGQSNKDALLEIIGKCRAAISSKLQNPPEDEILALSYAARAIDAAFRAIHPLRGTGAIDEHQVYLTHLSMHGNLLPATSGAGGLILPKNNSSRLGTALPHFFQNLIRIDEADAPVVRYRIGPSAGTRLGGGRVAVAALVVNEGTVTWRASSHGAVMELEPSAVAGVAASILPVLDELSSHGVCVVVMPELVSHTEVRTAIMGWMRRNADVAPLIVAGSEPIEVETGKARVNRSFVLGPGGFEIWTQDKAHQFVFTADLLKDANLVPYLGCDDIQEECFGSTSIVEVRDLPGLGRGMVSICEDFDRDLPGPRVARLTGPDLLMVPVLDCPPKPRNWWSQGGMTRTRDPGARVIIANSYALMGRLPAPSTGWHDNSIGEVYAPGPPYAKISHVVKGPDGQPIAAVWSTPT